MSDNISNMPRDLQELEAKGRFRLSQYAKELKLVTDEESARIFMQGSNTAMAQRLLDELNKRDGGSKSKTKKGKPTRTPVNKAERVEQDSDNKKDASVETSLATMVKSLAAVEKYAAQLAHNNKQVMGKLADLEQLCITSLNLNSLLAEQVLQAPRNEVLGTCVEEMSSTASTLSSLLKSSKENTKEEDNEEEEDDDEGEEEDDEDED